MATKTGRALTVDEAREALAEAQRVIDADRAVQLADLAAADEREHDAVSAWCAAGVALAAIRARFAAVDNRHQEFVAAVTGGDPPLPAWLAWKAEQAAAQLEHDVYVREYRQTHPDAPPLPPGRNYDGTRGSGAPRETFSEAVDLVAALAAVDRAEARRLALLAERDAVVRKARTGGDGP